MSTPESATTTNSSPESRTNVYGKYYVCTIAQIINEIIEENEAKEELTLKHSKSNITSELDDFDDETETSNVFSGKKTPSISIQHYLERILKYTSLEDSTLILSLIYIDRICEIDGFKLNKLNIHRLILTSIIMAIKYNEDDFYDNTFYAKVCGVSFEDLRDLEEEFVKKINYTFFVKEDVYQKYEVYLNQYNKLK